MAIAILSAFPVFWDLLPVPFVVLQHSAVGAFVEPAVKNLRTTFGTVSGTSYLRSYNHRYGSHPTPTSANTTLAKVCSSLFIRLQP